MKIWGGDLSKEVEKFTSGEDIILDKKLVYWDAVASMAHAVMLEKIGILDRKELHCIKKVLLEIIRLDKKGKFQLKPELEDVHSNVEFFLTKKCGKVGGKIHSARSRNDQAAVDMLLYMKNELLNLTEVVIQLCKVIEKKASNAQLPMPGYTHMRKAMPTTMAHYLAAYCEMMIDDAEGLLKIYELIDKCPLGAGASFGSIIGIDRETVSELLGFEKCQVNTLCAISSRGKNEFLVVSSLNALMLDLSRMASDLILFSSDEFGFVEMKGEFCSGSSIMPHKNNPDVLELIRANSAHVVGLQCELACLAKGMVSGYNRDVQLSKGTAMDAFETTKSTIKIFVKVIDGLKFDGDKMKAACSKEVFSADVASMLVKKGIPLREAYMLVKKGRGLEHLEKSEVELVMNPEKNIRMKKHLGAPGDEKMLLRINSKLDGVRKQYGIKKFKFEKHTKRLAFGKV